MTLEPVEALKQRIVELEAENRALDADNARAWNRRDQILKDRNALLTRLNLGPLSSDEWQIRAIRSEAERDQLAASLEMARKGIQAFIAGDYPHPHNMAEYKCSHGRNSEDCCQCDCEYFKNLLAELSNPAATLDERDRAVAKRCIEVITASFDGNFDPDGDIETTWKLCIKVIEREFGLEG